jgi:hypothetical protein
LATSHLAGVHAVHAGRRFTGTEGETPMTGQRRTGLLAALLLAGSTLHAGAFQDTPEDPPSDSTVESDPAVTEAGADPAPPESELTQELRTAHAEWTARVQAEQADIDRYQPRNFLGDRVQLEWITYVVNEVEFVDLIDAGVEEYTQRAEEGQVFCIVDITLNNVSGISNIGHLTRCSLIDEAGSRYALDEDAILALKFEYARTSKRPVTFHWRAGRLQPGVPVRAQVVYRIPEEAARGDLVLEIPKQKMTVQVRLEVRPEDDPPRLERPATAHWSLQDGISKRPKPARISMGLNEWVSLTKSAHLVTGIEFQDDLGSRRSMAPEEGIYLRVDTIFENKTEQEVSFRGTAGLVVSAEDGRRYRPVRIDVPAKIPAWKTVTMESFFLLPASIADDRLDLLAYQPVWTLTHASPDTYGWINLKP